MWKNNFLNIILTCQEAFSKGFKKKTEFTDYTG